MIKVFVETLSISFIRVWSIKYMEWDQVYICICNHSKWCYKGSSQSDLSVVTYCILYTLFSKYNTVHCNTDFQSVHNRAFRYWSAMNHWYHWNHWNQSLLSLLFCLPVHCILIWRTKHLKIGLKSGNTGKTGSFRQRPSNRFDYCRHHKITEWGVDYCLDCWHTLLYIVTHCWTVFAVLIALSFHVKDLHIIYG